jgi:photosystem II stability/assembly factor-like uncharacterized protein
LCLLFVSIIIIRLHAQNFWNPTNGPYGGTINALKITPNGNIYAGGSGGIFYSTNNGDNWLPLNNGLNGVAVKSIAFDLSGNLLIGTDVGIYRSTDGGNSWSLISSSLGNIFVNCVAVNSSGYIFLGATSFGVYRSTNNGSTWANVSGGLSNMQIYSMEFNKNGDLYVGTNAGLNRSTNNGTNWQKLDTVLNSDQVFAVAFNSSGNIFTASTAHGVSRSTDNGVSWQQINAGIDVANALSLIIDSSGNLYSGAFGGIYFSTDNGDNWTKLNSGLIVNYSVYCFAINANSTVFAGTYLAGIYRSNGSGANWSQINNQLSQSAVNSIAVNPLGQIFAYATNYGIFNSTNNGSNWNKLDALGNNFIQSLAINKNGDIFAGTNGIYRSTDNGQNFIQTNNLLSNSFITALVIDSLGYIYASTTNGSIWLSTNNGFDWNTIDNGFTTKYISCLNVKSDGEIYAGTFDTGDIYYSPDRGKTWNKLNVGYSPTNLYSIEVKQNNLIFTATALGVYRSTNNGLSWSSINNGITNPNNVRKLVQNSVGYFFASSTDGVYESTNNGTNWKQINSGLGKINSPVLSFDLNGYLLAGTSGSGVYRSVNSTIPPLPAIPLAKLPLDKASQSPLTVSLSWDSVAYTESYTVQVATDSSFTNLIVNDSTITAITRQVTGLSDGARYYWRVAAKNVIGTSSYSDIRSFSTVINTPGTLTAQALPSERIILSWTDKSNNNLGYIIERKLAAENNYIVIDTLKSDIIGYTDTTLISINTYQYRIKSYNLVETSAYSNEVTIKTLPPYPSLPLLIAPLNNLSNLSATLYLSWNTSTSADSYRLQVSKDSTFKSFILNDSTLTTPTRQVTGLDDGVRYYWRVNSKNAAGISPYSDIRLFSTILNTPGNLSASALWGYKVLLKWTDASNNESGYVIERKLSADTSYTLIDSVKLNIITFTDSSLTSINTYNYRVKAYNTYGSSLYSNIASVSTITSVNSKYSQIPTKYELSQNYPNPFNPTTIIEYGLPSQSLVKIVVYNILGEVVKELANGQQSAGYHNVSFGANNISSGIYFYKIEAKASDGSKQFREIKKMMLLK